MGGRSWIVVNMLTVASEGGRYKVVQGSGYVLRLCSHGRQVDFRRVKIKKFNKVMWCRTLNELVRFHNGLPLGIMFFFIILSLTIVIDTTNLLTMTRQPTTGWFWCSTFHSHIINNNNKRSTSTLYVFIIAFFSYYSYILDTESTDNNSTEQQQQRWQEKNSIENGRSVRFIL